MMVFQFLHQANLCFLFHRLVRRAVFTHAEGIVSPYKLDRHFHQSCQTGCWFHVIRENEECAASRYDTTVKIHTDAHASHGEFAHSCLEEGSREVVCCECMGLFEESVGLVGVGKVG